MELYTKIWKDNTSLITINNGTMELAFSDFGCTITAIRIGGKNLVLAYDDPDDYFNDAFYLGCIVGRVTGRISNGGFEIDGREYALAKNDGSRTHHLHGGISGFNRKLFTLTGTGKAADAASATLHYRSPHMQEGYPGNLDVFVTYSLTGKNEVVMEYRAITDRATHVNLTNHSYFNFSDTHAAAGTHELFVDADSYVFCDDDFIPTGELRKVDNDIHDFRKMRRVSRNLNECFVLNGDKNDDHVKAELYDPASKIRMSVRTTSPGLLFYTGDYLEGSFVAGGGVCLETQFFPDTPNCKEFAGTLLRPGEEFYQRTSFTFSF
jgi:aldose 1-epimerase